MCFTHYESSSPLLSAQAKEDEQDALIDYTALGPLRTYHV